MARALPMGFEMNFRVLWNRSGDIMFITEYGLPSRMKSLTAARYVCKNTMTMTTVITARAVIRNVKTKCATVIGDIININRVSSSFLCFTVASPKMCPTLFIQLTNRIKSPALDTVIILKATIRCAGLMWTGLKLHCKIRLLKANLTFFAFNIAVEEKSWQQVTYSKEYCKNKQHAEQA